MLPDYFIFPSVEQRYFTGCAAPALSASACALLAGALLCWGKRCRRHRRHCFSAASSFSWVRSTVASRRSARGARCRRRSVGKLLWPRLFRLVRVKLNLSCWPSVPRLLTYYTLLVSVQCAATVQCSGELGATVVCVILELLLSPLCCL